MHFLHAWRTLSPGQPLLPFDKPGSDWQAARTKLVFHRHGLKCRPSSMDVRQLPQQTKPASVRHMYSGASATHRHSNRKTAASVTMQPRGWCSRMHSNKKASHALAHITIAYVHKTNTYCTLCGGMQAGTYTQTQTCKHTHNSCFLSLAGTTTEASPDPGILWPTCSRHTLLTGLCHRRDVVLGSIYRIIARSSQYLPNFHKKLFMINWKLLFLLQLVFNLVLLYSHPKRK